MKTRRQRATVLTTQGSYTTEIHDLLTELSAKVHILASGDNLRLAYDQATHVLIPGGADIDPRLYGEKRTWARPVAPDRDAVESELVSWALAEGKPLMGICRGHQMIAAMAGGKLYQDIASDAKVLHSNFYHRIRLDTRSRLAGAVGGWSLVNSYHHQAVRVVPPGWRVAAESFDAVIEAIEHPRLPVVSVQWHPEALGDGASERLFLLFLGIEEG